MAKKNIFKHIYGDGYNDIDWSVIVSLTDKTWKHFDGVDTLGAFVDKDTIVHETIFGPGVKMPKHIHSNVDEKIVVLDGNILVNGKLLKATESMRLSSYYPHSISSKDGARMLFFFKRVY